MTDARDAGMMNESWQAVQTVGYIIEGESRAYEREKVKALGKDLARILAEHPETELPQADDTDIEPRLTAWPLEYFAVHSVARLANTFNFNDGEMVNTRRDERTEAERCADDDELTKIFGEPLREENQKDN
jgi:hypothetical protein